jgi:hypothetical protein
LIKNTAKELIITADELQNTANQLKLYASAIQRATATTEAEKRFFAEIDAMNDERRKLGLDIIVPLIEDTFNYEPTESAYPSPIIDNG